MWVWPLLRRGNKIAPMGHIGKLSGRNPLFFLEKQEKDKKDELSRKKGLRVRAPNRKYHFTGGAEAHNGTPDGTTERRSSGTDGRKIWADEAGRAKSKSAAG